MIIILFSILSALAADKHDIYEIWDQDMLITCAKADIAPAYLYAGLQVKKHNTSKSNRELVLDNKDCQQIIFNN